MPKVIILKSLVQLSKRKFKMLSIELSLVESVFGVYIIVECIQFKGKKKLSQDYYKASYALDIK
jgi:hypothetical protein